MPWAVEWTAGEFAALLRARAAWRDSHSQPLPALPARERHMIACASDLPTALVEVELAAPTQARLDWERRQETDRSSQRRDTGLLPEVARRQDHDGDTRAGGVE
ncbi:hypothetical protein SAMN05661080_05151 [Modestobacter sp. DSM 44400]|nr:hypothetical protein SAMN05661080_05151 [Modestobacter sp. DSM 44400]